MVPHNSSKNEKSYKFFKRALQSHSAERDQFVEDRVGVHDETYTAVFCFAGA